MEMEVMENTYPKLLPKCMAEKIRLKILHNEEFNFSVGSESSV